MPKRIRWVTRFRTRSTAPKRAQADAVQNNYQVPEVGVPPKEPPSEPPSTQQCEPARQSNNTLMASAPTFFIPAVGEVGAASALQRTYSELSAQKSRRYPERLHLYSYKYVYGVDAAQNALLPRPPRPSSYPQLGYDAAMMIAVTALQSEWQRQQQLQALQAPQLEARQRVLEKMRIARAALAAKRRLAAQPAPVVSDTYTAICSAQRQNSARDEQTVYCTASYSTAMPAVVAKGLAFSVDTYCAGAPCTVYDGGSVLAYELAGLVSALAGQTNAKEHSTTAQKDLSQLRLPTVIVGKCGSLETQAKKKPGRAKALYTQQTIWQAYEAQAAKQAKHGKAYHNRAPRARLYRLRTKQSLRYRTNYQRFSNFAPLPLADLALAPHESSLLISSSVAEPSAPINWWDAAENSLLRRAMDVHGDDLSFIAQTYFQDKAADDVADWANCLIGASFIRDERIFKGKNGSTEARQVRMVDFPRLYKEYKHDFLAAWKQNARFMSLNLFCEHYYRAASTCKSLYKAARIQELIVAVCALPESKARELGVRWPIKSADVTALVARFDKELRECEDASFGF